MQDDVPLVDWKWQPPLFYERNEQPLQWIKRGHLRIRVKWQAIANTREPQGKTARLDRLGEIIDAGIILRQRVIPDERSTCQKSPVEKNQNRRQDRNGNRVSTRSSRMRDFFFRLRQGYAPVLRPAPRATAATSQGFRRPGWATT